MARPAAATRRRSRRGIAAPILWSLCVPPLVARGDDCLAQRSALVADCDWAVYGAENPDVRAAMPEADFRDHYLDFGRAEGRRCAPRAGAAHPDEACFLADHAAGTLAAVPAAARRWPRTGGDATDPGRFWASSRAWRALAAMVDVEGFRLLDVGAGDGSAGEIARRVYGLASFRALERTGWGAGGAGKTMGVASGSPWADVEWYESLPLPCADSSADVASAAYVLHHVPLAEQVPLVAELARCSAAWVLVCEDLDLPGFEAYNAEHAADSGTEGYNFRDRKGWLAVFEAAGLDAVASGPAFDWDHPAAYFVLRKRPPRGAPKPAATLDDQRRRFLEGMYRGFERGRHAARAPHVREDPAGPAPRRMLSLLAFDDDGAAAG